MLSRFLCDPFASVIRFNKNPSVARKSDVPSDNPSRWHNLRRFSHKFQSFVPSRNLKSHKLNACFGMFIIGDPVFIACRKNDACIEMDGAHNPAGARVIDTRVAAPYSQKRFEYYGS